MWNIIPIYFFGKYIILLHLMTLSGKYLQFLYKCAVRQQKAICSIYNFK